MVVRCDRFKLRHINEISAHQRVGFFLRRETVESAGATSV